MVVVLCTVLATAALAATDEPSDFDVHAFTAEDESAAPQPSIAEAIHLLPTTRPSGRAIQSVGYLGVVVPPSLEAQARHWLLPRQADLAAVEAATLEALVEHFPMSDAWDPIVEADVVALRAGDTSPARVARINEALGVDAVFVLYADAAPSWPGDLLLDARLLGGRTEPGAFEYDSRMTLPGGLEPYGRFNLAVLPLALLLLAPILWPLVRGAGKVVVQLPPDKVGAEVDPSERTGRGDRRGITSILLRPRGQNSRNDAGLSRSMVGSTTEFTKLRPGSYVVEVRRVYRDPKSSEVSCIQSQEKIAHVRRGDTVTLRFELSTEEFPVELKIRDGEQEVVDGRTAIGVRGRPQLTRYVREPANTLNLPSGAHVLLVAHQDRVYERTIEVASADERVSASVDVSSDEGIVFAGCSDAVQPYIQGDLEAAARALREGGDEESADLVLAELYRARGDTHQAARHLQAAGRLREAAELTESGDDTARSAELFEQAGELSKAAENYQRAGDYEAAIRAFEQAQDLESAIGCAFQSGDRGRAVGLLEKQGSFFEAGRVALELDEIDRALRLYQKVTLRDPHYGEACITLAQLLLRRDEAELALQKLDEGVEAIGSDDFLELREQIGMQLEGQGRFEAAVEAYEAIRKRDIDYPGVASRIDALRQQMRDEGATMAQQLAAVDGAADPTSTAPLESRYEIGSELGRGAMGVVYEARDRRLGRRVALKRLSDSLKEHPTAVRLFLREARSAAALNHGNIVTLFDADQENGVYYLTMEFLDGLPVDAVLKKHERLSARDALRLSTQVSAGLQYAHENRIIHRDIKPSNLFFTTSKQVKIMDFGLAKMVQEVRKAASMIGGTPYYMAPEQAVGDPTDHRADQYAFGVTLFQLVTGRVPFSEGDVLYHHRHTPAPDPREFAVDLPAELAELIQRLMEKHPEDRFAETGEVTEALERLSRAAGA